MSLTLLIIASSLLLISIISFLIIILTTKPKDNVILVRKVGYIDFFKVNFTGKKKISINNIDYIIDDQAVSSTSKMKKVLIFDEFNPRPRKLNYKKDNWLSMDTITKVMNEEHIHSLIKKEDQVKDVLLLFGSIASLINTAILIFIALQQFGVVGQVTGG